MSDVQGKVLGVLRPAEPAALGTTLIHEHILFDLSVYHDQRFGPARPSRCRTSRSGSSTSGC